MLHMLQMLHWLHWLHLLHLLPVASFANRFSSPMQTLLEYKQGMLEGHASTLYEKLNDNSQLAKIDDARLREYTRVVKTFCANLLEDVQASATAKSSSSSSSRSPGAATGGAGAGAGAGAGSSTPAAGGAGRGR